MLLFSYIVYNEENHVFIHLKKMELYRVPLYTTDIDIVLKALKYFRIYLKYTYTLFFLSNHKIPLNIRLM